MPEPTYAFGSFGEIVPNPDPPAPTQAQLDDLAQIRAALAVEDPWAGEPPQLYTHHVKR